MESWRNQDLLFLRVRQVGLPDQKLHYLRDIYTTAVDIRSVPSPLTVIDPLFRVRKIVHSEVFVWTKAVQQRGEMQRVVWTK